MTDHELPPPNVFWDMGAILVPWLLVSVPLLVFLLR
jgi:hypothetical protein